VFPSKHSTRILKQRRYIATDQMRGFPGAALQHRGPHLRAAATFDPGRAEWPLLALAEQANVQSSAGSITSRSGVGLVDGEHTTVLEDLDRARAATHFHPLADMRECHAVLPPLKGDQAVDPDHAHTDIARPVAGHISWFDRAPRDRLRTLGRAPAARSSPCIVAAGVGMHRHESVALCATAIALVDDVPGPGTYDHAVFSLSIRTVAGTLPSRRKASL
jgi:hypothetical protein